MDNNLWYMVDFQVDNGQVRAIREYFVSGAYLRIYLSDCLQILHTTPTFGSVVPYYDLFRRIDTHVVSTADLENYWAD